MVSKLLRVTEVAQTLDISRALAYRLVARGDIPSFRIGKTVRVKPEDLEIFISIHTGNKKGIATDIIGGLHEFQK